jgi:hypothetical protein
MQGNVFHDLFPNHGFLCVLKKVFWLQMYLLLLVASDAIMFDFLGLVSLDLVSYKL